MSMDLFGEVAGRIGFEGGGESNVTITPTLESGTKIADYTIDETSGSLYAPDDVKDVLVRDSQSLEYQSVVNNAKNALIDLISYVRRNELSQELMTLENDFDLKLTLKQNNLTAGANITIIDDVISASGGGGLDLPTNGTPVAIGTFGNQTIYIQYFEQSLAGTTYGTRNVWQGQGGDMVISCSCVAYPIGNPATKAVVPYSRSNQASFSWTDNEYEALPTIAVNYGLDSNLWTRNSAILKGCVIFIR